MLVIAWFKLTCHLAVARVGEPYFTRICVTIFAQPAITCSNLTIDTPEQGVKYILNKVLTITTLKRQQWLRLGVFIVNFEHISHLILVFLLLILSK